MKQLEIEKNVVQITIVIFLIMLVDFKINVDELICLN